MDCAGWVLLKIAETPVKNLEKVTPEKIDSLE